MCVTGGSSPGARDATGSMILFRSMHQLGRQCTHNEWEDQVGGTKMKGRKRVSEEDSKSGFTASKQVAFYHGHNTAMKKRGRYTALFGDRSDNGRC